MKTTSNNYLKHSSDESRSGTCDQQHLFAYKTVLHENSNDNDKKNWKVENKMLCIVVMPTYLSSNPSDAYRKLFIFLPFMHIGTKYTGYESSNLPKWTCF